MSWFQKLMPSRIRTEGGNKRTVPEGLWTKCNSCSAVLYRPELERNLSVCPKCNAHMALNARERIKTFLDPGKNREIAGGLEPADPLRFRDSKRYRDRITAAQKKTGEKDALVAMAGKLGGQDIVACAFEFAYMGGSMGSVVGEKFARAGQECLRTRAPLVCFSATGGARMQEGLLSLMQMAKTSAVLGRMADAGIPYISVLTHPTTGGVSASLGMLGDIIIAEPAALIGFAGPRVIEQTVREKLPEGFQRSEFLLEKGAIDMILDRRALREEITSMLGLMTGGGRPNRSVVRSSLPSQTLAPVSSPSLPDTLSDWLALIERRHPKSVDLGLERCGEVWRRMGTPQPAARIFVVAGTNGKGSTVATLCSVLGALGYSRGSFTSPHIVRFNERVRLNGKQVSDELLLQAFERVEAARGDVSLSYFEFSTLAAISILEDAGLDFAVMEVGLGGRLDAVNLLDADCAVITPIGLDHQEYLGDDLASIGREKAGIIRPGRPVICGESHPPETVVTTAAALSAPLKRLGRDFTVRRHAGGVRFGLGEKQIDLPFPALDGHHQLNNMATAFAALLELVPDAVLDPDALGRGLRAVLLQGRFERISQRPAISLNVGHNPLAARAVAVTLGSAMKAEGMKRCRCVIAMLADKDAAAVAEELRSAVSTWYAAGLKGDRGQSGADLAGRLAQAGGSLDIRAFGSVRQALEAAVADSGPADCVLVFGSFFTAAEVLQAQ